MSPGQMSHMTQFT
uniref:Uncharacterized protein n=1 Tax=Anguilla anguilla TaxID=7936 RepID=A0A0E9TCL6_ANGAN